MNANQIINMIIRMVMRQVINRGVRAGMDAAGNQMAKRKRPRPPQEERGPKDRDPYS